jgi:hypothetical protein
MTDLVADHVSAAGRKPLPLGLGLLAGAIMSLGLWAGLFWLAGAVL